VNDRPFQFLIDTGSSKSCVRLDVVRNVLKLPITSLNDDDAKSLISASGEIIRVCGTVYLNLNLNGVQYGHKFVVLKKLTNDFILGSDLFVATKAKINYSSNNISFWEDSVTLPFNAEVSEIDNCRAIVMADCLSRRNYSPADIRHLETLIYGEGTVNTISEPPNPNAGKNNAGKISQATRLKQSSAMGVNKTNFLPHFELNREQNSIGSQTETINLSELDVNESQVSNSPQIEQIGLPELIKSSTNLFFSEKEKIYVANSSNDGNDTKQDSNLESNISIPVGESKNELSSDLNKLPILEKDDSASHGNVTGLSDTALKEFARTAPLNKVTVKAENSNSNVYESRNPRVTATRTFKPVQTGTLSGAESHMGQIVEVSPSHVGPALYVAPIPPYVTRLTSPLFMRFPMAGCFQGISADTKLVPVVKSIITKSGAAADISSVPDISRKQRLTDSSDNPRTDLDPGDNYCNSPSTNNRSREGAGVGVGRPTENYQLVTANSQPKDLDFHTVLRTRTDPDDSNFDTPLASSHKISSTADECPAGNCQLVTAISRPSGLDPDKVPLGGVFIRPLGVATGLLGRPLERTGVGPVTTGVDQTPISENGRINVDDSDPQYESYTGGHSNIESLQRESDNLSDLISYFSTGELPSWM
jgi:hypothetical protein